jgi:glycosyltransferase involved in cell wall biosynthesis
VHTSSGSGLRLLIVNYEFPPIGGGASFACLGLARTLVARGHRVDVLTSRLKGQPRFEEIEGIRVHRVRSWRHGHHECGLRGAATFLLFAFLRMRHLIASERYHLVHYFFGLPSGVLSLYSFGKHRIPYIVSLRGSDVPGYDSTDRPLVFTHQLLASVNRRIWRHAMSVVANSAALRDLAAAFEPTIPFQIVPNAVIDESALAARTAPAGSQVQLLCVARLIERKGLGVLLTAMSKLTHQNVMLHIVGGGRDEQQLRRMAQDIGVADKITFHGSLPHERVMNMYRTCDIFVLPTLSESCSMALLEAMSMGLPVVTTRVGGNPFLIQDGKNGMLVAPGDVAELVEALDMLIHDPARRHGIGNANMRKIADEFTWSINAERYEGVYRQALATTAHPA